MALLLLGCLFAGLASRLANAIESYQGTPWARPETARSGSIPERRKDSETEMKWNLLEEEPCSVARTVAVIGDRWTLLVLRDCFLRVRRFEDFQTRLGVTRHVLADRLKKLVRCGVLRR